VTALRTLLLRHRALAILLLAAALCLKALVPAGYMLEAGHKVLRVAVCLDSSGHTVTRDIVVPMKGSPAGDAAKHAAAGKACAWSSLAMASLGGADALLLAAALVFILALGFAPLAAPRPRRAVWLRPPLRGPPLTA
jgi:hypothetical protein